MEFHRTTRTRRLPPMQWVGFNSILVVASFCSYQLPRQDADNINPKAEVYDMALGSLVGTGDRLATV